VDGRRRTLGGCSAVHQEAAAEFKQLNSSILCSRTPLPSLPHIHLQHNNTKQPIQEYERCGKFIFPVCSRIAGRQIDQTFGIMDVKGVGMSHLTGEVKRLVSMLTKYDQVGGLALVLLTCG